MLDLQRVKEKEKEMYRMGGRGDDITAQTQMILCVHESVCVCQYTSVRENVCVTVCVSVCVALTHGEHSVTTQGADGDVEAYWEDDVSPHTH